MLDAKRLMNVKMYWFSTSIVALMVFASSYTYFYSAATIDGIREMGFPDFFRIQLGVLQFLGAAVLIYPKIPSLAKEWAYCGITLFYLTAIVAHTAHGDPVALSMISVFFLGLLYISHRCLHRPSNGLLFKPHS